MFRNTSTLLLAGALIVLPACSTHYAKIDLSQENFNSVPISILNRVPFSEQTSQLCGPTALYMVAKNLKPQLELAEVIMMTYSPASQGSFKQDMLGAVRRLGLAPYKVKSLGEIIQSLAEKNPVLIFHQTKFFGKNFWHYSVLTGYDLAGENFNVHIGEFPHRRMSMREVAGSWLEGGSWAFVVKPPTEMASFANYDEAIDNALALMRLGFNAEVREIITLLSNRWPARYEHDVVLSELHMKESQPGLALKSLKKAHAKNPKNQKLKQKISEFATAR